MGFPKIFGSEITINVSQLLLLNPDETAGVKNKSTKALMVKKLFLVWHYSKSRDKSNLPKNNNTCHTKAALIHSAVLVILYLCLGI